MIFGAFIPQGWKMELSSIDGAEAKWAKAVEIAVLAEQLGYDSIWVYDHFHNVPRPAHEAVFECWTTMAAISQRTTSRAARPDGRLQLLSPAERAGEDHLDHRRHQRRPSRLGDRCRLVRERVPRLRLRVPRAEGAHRDASRVRRDRAARCGPTSETTYEGRYYSLHRAHCDPKPLQQPHPPIWIGGGGRAADVAGRRPPCRLRQLRRQARRVGRARPSVLKGHCKDVGRDYDEIRKTWSPEVFVRETEAGGRRGRLTVVLGRAGRVVDGRQPGGHARAGGREDPAVPRPRLHRVRAVVLRLPRHRDARLFAEKVIPQFR